MKVLILSLAFAVCACSSPPRVLSVKSEPAEAEVCIKGKYQSQYLPSNKSCIGTTPLEADSIQIPDDSGRMRIVKFKDIESSKEQFYLIISRKGYEPQSVQVPAWDQYVMLHPEPAATPQAVQAPAPAPVIPLAPSVPSGKGVAKISSAPVGALVYVNDYLKGNTPYTLEADGTQTVRIKLEQAGYHPMERSITMEPGKNLEINLALEPTAAEPQHP